MTRTSTTAETMRMSATVMPSIESTVLVPRLAGTIVSSTARARAMAANRNGCQVGGLFQTSIWSRNEDRNSPAADDVTMP